MAFLAVFTLYTFLGYTIKILTRGKVIKLDKNIEPSNTGIMPYSNTGCIFSIFTLGSKSKTTIIINPLTKYSINSETRPMVSIPYKTAITTAIIKRAFMA